MNTQKIVNEHGDENERIDLSLRDRTVELLADGIDCHGRFVGGKGRENGIFLSVGAHRVDVILHVFEFAADALAGMAVQNFVQLQDIVRRNGDIFVVLMNDVEGVAVARDLLLVARARRGLVG